MTRKQNVAYLRVSTDAQIEKYGLDVQKQKILDYCDKKGVVIDNWYIDGGYTGSNINRPEIQNLLEDSQNGLIDTVYIYKLDRMSRDVIDTLTILYRILPQYGVKIVSMTEELKFDNPMDKVMVGVNAIMGQYEREVIYMRTRAGMIERVKKGLWPGGGNLPSGYYYDRNDGMLHIDGKQAEKVREAFRLYLEGYSCDRIAVMLGFKGDAVVSSILKRKTYLGLIEYKGNVYQGKHEAIIDENTFYKVQEMMKKRSTKTFVSNNNMLTGLCYCGICGARMRYQNWGNYHKLICYSQYSYKYTKQYMIKDPNCNNKKNKAKYIEDEVEIYFKEFAINIQEDNNKRKNNSENIEKTIESTNLKIKKLYSLYIERESENLLDMISKEEDRLKDLKKQLQNEKNNNIKNTKKQIERIRKMSDAWDYLSTKEKNMILKECVDKIIITGEDIDIYFRTL